MKSKWVWPMAATVAIIVVASSCVPDHDAKHERLTEAVATFEERLKMMETRIAQLEYPAIPTVSIDYIDVAKTQCNPSPDSISLGYPGLVRFQNNTDNDLSVEFKDPLAFSFVVPSMGHETVHVDPQTFEGTRMFGYRLIAECYNETLPGPFVIIP